jgi:hypothetical protein
VVSGGVREDERKVRQHGSGASIGGPGLHSAGARLKLSFKLIQKYSNGSNEIRIPPNLAGSKDTSPCSKNLK